MLSECSPFDVISQRHLPVHRLPRHFGTKHFSVHQTVQLTFDNDVPNRNRRFLLTRANSFGQEIYSAVHDGLMRCATSAPEDGSSNGEAIATSAI